MKRTSTNIVRHHDPISGHARIVVHTTEGILNAEDLPRFFRTVQADAHMTIDRQADAVHMVPDTQKAWHVMNYNPTSLGIELCGFARWTTHEWVHDSHWQLLRLAAALSNWSHRWNIPLRHSVRHGVCGHIDLGSAGGGHWDPGYHFPWKYVLYLARLHYYRDRGWNKSRGWRRVAFARYKRYCHAVQRRHGVKPNTTL